MCGKPAGYELREEPDALGLARLSLSQQPERSVQVQVRPRHSHEQEVGIADEAWQCGDAEPLAHRCDCAAASVVLNGTSVV